MNNNLNSNNIDANLNPDLNSNTNPDLNNLNPNTNLGINSNLTLNATNSIIVQYQEGTMENLISSANDNNNSQLAYLKTLDNLSQTNPNKITLDKVANISQQWDQTSRGLTTTSQVAIAVTAVVASCALTSCLAAPEAVAVGAGTGATAGATTATTATVARITLSEATTATRCVCKQRQRLFS